MSNKQIISYVKKQKEKAKSSKGDQEQEGVCTGELVTILSRGILVDLTEVTFERSLERSEGLGCGDIQEKNNAG